MKRIYTITTIVLLSVTMIISSCKKEVDGCTDSSAMNYLSDATSNDGSCVYAYDIAQGVWYFTSECEEGSSEDFQDFLPSYVNVEGDGDGKLSFTMLDTINVNATIDNNGNVNIPTQTLFSIDTVVLGFPLSVPLEVSGTGLIESQDSGNLILNYSLEPLLNFTCTADLYREE
jgi:hypothetical protein